MIIQEAECLQDLVLCVAVQDYVGDNLEEFSKANGAAAKFRNFPRGGMPSGPRPLCPGLGFCGL